MKKTKNSSALLRQLASANSQTGANSGGRRVPSASDLRATSISGGSPVKGIAFGKESKAAQGTTKASSSTSELTGFISGTLTHGLSGSVSSLFSVSGLGAIGSLVSGLAGLFGGGKSQPAPIPAFSLPGSQMQDISVRGNSAQTNLATNSPSASTYGQLPDSSAATHSLADQHQQIAQAVKTALLQSHSLSDVISEL